jgi:hypothetical protein
MEFLQPYNINRKYSDTFREEIVQQGPERLANFLIDPKSKKFGDLILDVFGACDLLTFDPENWGRQK